MVSVLLDFLLDSSASAGNTQNSLEEKKDAQIKSINKEVEGGEHNRKSATSLILFEEVKFT